MSTNTTLVPKYPISDEDMLELLKKYPFLKHSYFWKQEPDDVNKTDAENIESNWYKIWDGLGWENLWKNRYLPRLFKEYDSWDEETKKQFFITDTKEKFGELRIYCSFSTKNQLESIAGWLSNFTCQYCGAEPRENGKRVIWTTGGWITHLCKDCARKYLIKEVPEDKIEEELNSMKEIACTYGYKRFSEDGMIRVTFKETDDGWLEKDKVEKLNEQKERKLFLDSINAK